MLNNYMFTASFYGAAEFAFFGNQGKIISCGRKPQAKSTCEHLN